jgi:hypothetical protein
MSVFGLGNRKVVLPAAARIYLREIRQQTPAVQNADDIVANALRYAAQPRALPTIEIVIPGAGSVNDADASGGPIRVSVTSEAEQSLDRLREQHGAAQDDASLILDALRKTARSCGFVPSNEEQIANVFDLGPEFDRAAEISDFDDDKVRT